MGNAFLSIGGGNLVDATSKDRALAFLKELEETLNSKLPGPTDMDPWIRSTVAEAKTDDKKKHLRSPEAVFLNEQALPKLFDLLIHRGLSREQAQEALLSENYRGTPELALGSPVRWERHPFRKTLGARPSDIYLGWTKPDKHGLAQSCPDFSLHKPFPHAILFEGKYFSEGSLELAQRQLVEDIYEAFFYRGLAPLAAARKYPDWNYDYACLMAYDASASGTLSKAWERLPIETRSSFWESANVYAMILRPN
jgi:hypothetical protein